MARNKTVAPLRTSGFAWGKERVALGLSMRDLERLSGITRATLSRVEAGRLIPTSEEYDAVMDALRKARGPETSA